MKKIIRQYGSWEYVPLDDRALPKEEQTTVVLKPLTQIERMQVWDSSSWVEQDEAGNRVLRKRSFELARELCLSHIAEVRNFPPREELFAEPVEGEGDARRSLGYGPDRGQPWPTDDAGRVAYLEQFDDFVLLEIGNEIREHSSISEEEKN